MSIYDLNAYEVLQTEDLSDLKSKGTLLKHKKSGARVLLMENDDEEQGVYNWIPYTTVRQYRSSTHYGTFCSVRIERIPGEGSVC